MSSCSLSGLYVYGDSNFVSLRISPNMASASSIGLGPAAIGFRRRHASFVHIF